MEHPRFRAAYDFLVVRERGGEDTAGMGDWWTRYQDAHEEDRPALLEALPNAGGGGKKRKRSGRRRRSKGS
jgi:poly(A) polymerase